MFCLLFFQVVDLSAQNYLSEGVTSSDTAIATYAFVTVFLGDVGTRLKLIINWMTKCLKLQRMKRRILMKPVSRFSLLSCNEWFRRSKTSFRTFQVHVIAGHWDFYFSPIATQNNRLKLTFILVITSDQELEDPLKKGKYAIMNETSLFYPNINLFAKSRCWLLQSPHTN